MCTEYIDEPAPVEDWNGPGGGCAGGAVLVFERVDMGRFSGQLAGGVNPVY